MTAKSFPGVAGGARLDVWFEPGRGISVRASERQVIAEGFRSTAEAEAWIVDLQRRQRGALN